MRDLVETLTDKERRTVSLLSLLALLALVFFLFVSLRERNRFLQAREDLARMEQDYGVLDEARLKARADWLAWEEARLDLEDLRKTFFYAEGEGIRPLRLDLQKIFVEAGIYVPEISYQYAEMERENTRKVTAGFVFKGSYPVLKRFLSAVERFPKSVTIEQIDFLNTGGEGGFLELRLNLAGYYEK